MGMLSPGPGQKPRAKSAPREDDDPTRAAEIVIMLFPAGATPAADADADAKDVGKEMLPAWLTRLARRIGLQAWISVPAPNAGQMLAAVCVFAWTALVLGTLAIMIPAGMTAGAIIAVIALELAGFAAGSLTLRKYRKDS